MKYEAICLTVEAWLKLGHATGERIKAKQQIYNRMSEKLKNQGVESKLRRQPDWHAVGGP